MKYLTSLDKWLFVKINHDGANGFMDGLMPFMRQPLTWIPFYLFLIAFVIINFPKKAIGWMTTFGLTIAASDSISSKIIKPLIGRVRPCNDPELAEKIRMLAAYCGQNGSFTSSHAANHFAAAMFLFITLRKTWGNYTVVFFLWALIICYAQIYVGVHFPLDILGGAILGLTLGYLAASILVRKSGELTAALPTT